MRGPCELINVLLKKLDFGLGSLILGFAQVFGSSHGSKKPKPKTKNPRPFNVNTAHGGLIALEFLSNCRTLKCRTRLPGRPLSSRQRFQPCLRNNDPVSQFGVQPPSR